MLFWPLISKALAVIRAPKANKLAEQQPVD